MIKGHCYCADFLTIMCAPWPSGFSVLFRADGQLWAPDTHSLQEPVRTDDEREGKALILNNTLERGGLTRDEVCHALAGPGEVGDIGDVGEVTTGASCLS